MTSKYLYLHPYINCNRSGEGCNNWFGSITKKEIIQAEKDLNLSFPNMLKEFWLEVGYGFLSKGYDGQEGDINSILSPDTIADAMRPPYPNQILFHPEVIDFFELGYIKEGDILFFEVGDSADFLMMKTKSENPNAVYEMTGKKIEDSFERFIYRLYYESPEFYFHI